MTILVAAMVADMLKEAREHADRVPEQGREYAARASEAAES